MFHDFLIRQEVIKGSGKYFVAAQIGLKSSVIKFLARLSFMFWYPNIYIYIYIYRVSREECARLRENVS